MREGQLPFVPLGLVPIHFDVSSHFVSLDTFLRTSLATNVIVGDLNSQLFDNKLAYKLVVLPPEDGTYLIRLGIALLSGYAAVLAFSDTDFGKGVIRGLTNHDPEFWGEMIGSSIRNQLIAPAALPCPDPFAHAFETVVVAQSALAILEREPDDLISMGITSSKFEAALNARNDFYQACEDNQQVHGLGFDESPIFPIRRDDFARLKVSLLDRTDAPIRQTWDASVATIVITSPNWDRNDDQRAWKARLLDGKERYFTIDDEHFWDLVARGKIAPKITDRAQVQWAFPGNQKRRGTVLKVIEFNGEKLGFPLTETEIAEVLKHYNLSTTNNLPLFEQMEDD